MTSIKDISQACGYSPSTVSKSLNYATDVGKETAEKIRNVAEQMGYFPNSIARALKTNRTFNIGVLFVDATASGLTHEFFSSILNSFKVEADRRGYVITFISNQINRNRVSLLEHCRHRNYDGVMIACVNFKNPEVAELVSSEIPTLSIDYEFPTCTSILSDNLAGMKELTDYVIQKGHRKLAIIHGEGTEVTHIRLDSFFRTLNEKQIRIPKYFIKPALYHEPLHSQIATRELLSLPERPTCIFYPDDYSLLGGLDELEQHHLKVPEDMSIVGYDGIFLSQILRPRITIMHQDTETIGKRAAEELIEQIENPRTYKRHRVVVKQDLLEGETVQQL